MTFTHQWMWGPGLIGLTIGGTLYGVGVGQFIFYVRAFPSDNIQLKLLVFAVFALDTAHTIASLWSYHHQLVACRTNDTPRCTVYLPEFTVVGFFLVYCITFIVQSFYVHRVWIISGQNRVITSVVLVAAVTELVLGLLCMRALIHTRKTFALFTTEFVGMAAVASALCDAIITVSIAFFLRPARTGAYRRYNYIKRLNAVFVRMGLLSFINALGLAVTYYVQVDGVAQFLSAGPGAILSKSYVNSMLSVLNARKLIREEQEAEAQRAIENPTIPTISLSQ